ncbi:MAG: hypothetical protein P9L94_20615 [Candidatus Hinthialibacter antarcticus]|nr:hypothetical protein [Candidatus Hinthialibacter antarcticus]
MNQEFFNNTPVVWGPYLYIAITVLILLVIISVIYYFFKRFKKLEEFKNELQSLGLGEEGESTLVDMVKRYAMQEPLDILMSVKTFDQMAIQEIERILASAGSSKAKQKFINLIYEIRLKTYYAELIDANEEIEDSAGDAKTLVAAANI